MIVLGVIRSLFGSGYGIPKKYHSHVLRLMDEAYKAGVASRSREVSDMLRNMLGRDGDE